MGRGPHRKKAQIKRKKRTTARAHFWDREYDQHAHLLLSDTHSSDLEKFFRWLRRRDAYDLPTQGDCVLDIGCGNGRNVLYVCAQYACSGIGYDLSAQAIAQAKRKAIERQLDVQFYVHNINQPIPLKDESQKIVLDMMVSHVLTKENRRALLAEIKRVLVPGGFLFLKTFLRDGDLNAATLLQQYPGDEDGSYIHPHIGIQEHVFWQEEIEDDLAEFFTLHKVYKSHKHRDKKGRAHKRRSIVLYAQKAE